jgi:hypothetical protein
MTPLVAVTTQSRRKRHWAIRSWRAYAPLCGQGWGFDQAHLDRVGRRVVIDELPSCRRCDRIRANQEGGEQWAKRTPRSAISARPTW